MFYQLQMKCSEFLCCLVKLIFKVVSHDATLKIIHMQTSVFTGKKENKQTNINQTSFSTLQFFSCRSKNEETP